MCAFKQGPLFPLGITRFYPDVCNSASGLPAYDAHGSDLKTLGLGRFTRIVDATAEIPTSRQPLLCTLLPAILPIPSEPDPDLQPVWANEAMQRAYDIVQLVAVLERVRPSRKAGCSILQAEQNCAVDLADVYRDLQVLAVRSTQACAHPLGRAVGSIAGLFSAVSGIEGISCYLEDVKVDSVRRRALILAACRLVMSVLTDDGIAGRDIEVILIKSGPDAACLTVSANSQALRCGDDIVDDLAEILNAALRRSHERLGRVRVTLIFPM